MRLFALSFFALFPLTAQDQDPAKAQLEYTRAHYTKFEYRIPMRDGVKLFTSVYVPKDDSKQYPILLQRTPYSVVSYGVDNSRPFVGPSDLFCKEGFIVVYQDVRGRYLSEGTFTDVMPHKTTYNGPKDTDEATDTYDTIDWLVKNIPNNNGRVGQWGISYPGHYSAYALINSHPALKAVSPQAPMIDVGNGDDAYHNGAFYLAANFGFYSGFKVRKEPTRPTPNAREFDLGTNDEYDFFLRLGPLANANERYFKNQNEYWTDLLTHSTYDAYWQSRSLMQHMKDVKPAVLVVGGWFDAEDLAGPLKLYRAIGGDTAKAPLSLVMGPWPHGGWSRGPGRTLGNLDFRSATGDFFRKEIEFKFFMNHLKGDGGTLPKAWVFETGTNRWRKFQTWPPPEAKPRTLVLGPNGSLRFDTPSGSTAFDEYTSDPAHPVPVIGEIGEGMPRDYMTHDQRFAAQRPDVLTYMTEPLDHDITVAGPVAPKLKVATSGTDSDFIVKLIDVYPFDYPNGDAKDVHMGGYQQLVRGEPIRGKFRNGMSKPEAFVPNQPAQVEYVMPDVFHTFRPGHRIMVQIQSSWFPLVDRNPQNFINIPDAKSTDFVKALERIYHGSEVKLMVIE